MPTHLPNLTIAVLTVAATPAVFAQSGADDSGIAIVCPAIPGSDERLPDFTGPGCESVPFFEIDPQGRMIWVKTSVSIAEDRLDSAEPLGLFVLAKAASEIWLNGVFIGRNGVPANTRDEEGVGHMDAVVPVPRELVHAGNNELVLLMSSHRGFIHLASPVHAVMIGTFGSPQRFDIGNRWPALIAFGALLAGACYFAAIAIRGGSRRNALLLTVMSVVAAGQLFAEVSRALIAYPYPVHDLRLVAILLLALVFGLCLAAYLIWTFIPHRRTALLIGTAVVTAAMIIGAPGFDSKTVYAIFVPTLAGVGVTAFAAFRRMPHATTLLAALIVFAVIMLALPILFLDLLLYYSAAALLLFLFVLQGFTFEEERRLRRVESDRATRLEFALEKARSAATPAMLQVTRAGEIQRIPVDQIVSCTAAGDYVGLRLIDGREVLHDASMNELEELLPTTFLRVHRSHIVNSALVQKLKRSPSGVGRLYLADGSEMPVSRRIMPKVRSSFE